jgi:AraC-like DNA-binding protein
MAQRIHFARVADLGDLPQILTDASSPSAFNRFIGELGLSPSTLKRPDNLLLLSDMLALYEQAALVTGKNCFGLDLGRNMTIGTFGLFGKYVASAPDLGTALKRGRRAIRFHENHTRVALKHEAENVKLSYVVPFSGSYGWRHVSEMVLCILIDLVRSYAGYQWRPVRIETDCCGGPWLKIIEERFHCPVLCEQPALSIVLERNLLEMPRTNSEAIVDVVTLGDLKNQPFLPPQNIVEATRALISQNLLGGKSQLDSVARKMTIGPRSLQRRLKEEGTSFRNLLESARIGRAKDLLVEDRFLISDIAEATGYASITQFSRAFKKWEGQTPSSWRGASEA